VGTGTTDETTTEVKCRTCRRVYRPDCDWRQGRCPMHPTLWDQIKQLFTKVKNEKTLG